MVIITITKLGNHLVLAILRLAIQTSYKQLTISKQVANKLVMALP
jgi:hypothetical protein